MANTTNINLVKLTGTENMKQYPTVQAGNADIIDYQIGNLNTAVNTMANRDVQIDGVSIVSGNVANIPVASSSDLGVVKVDGSGLAMSDGKVVVDKATDSEIKAGTNTSKPIVPSSQDKAVFYGLAKAAGDTTQDDSANEVGTYTSQAKAAIHTMLDIPAIPTNVSSFTNDAGYLTQHQDISNKADLDQNGKVLSSQLPSYVDDVVEYDSVNVIAWDEWVSGTSYEVGDRVKVTTTESDETTVVGYICTTANSSATILDTEWREAESFPTEGESGKIYIALDTNLTYRWGGSSYVAIASDLALGETESTAYRGDRGAAAYAAAVTNVDSSPTASSTHLVTSGGVASQLATKADRDGTVLDSYLSRGRKTNTTIGTGSLAFGGYVTASGTYADAEGYYTRATGNYSHAEGYYTYATGTASHVEGYGESSTSTLYGAFGKGDHAEGYRTKANSGSSSTAYAAHAEGRTTTASNNAAHAEGSTTTASGQYSHSEGSSTTASGNGAHAEGASTKATGVYSHAEGSNTEANGDYSHAEGNYTKANGLYQHVSGSNNYYGELTSGSYTVTDDIAEEYIPHKFYKANSHVFKVVDNGVTTYYINHNNVLQYIYPHIEVEGTAAYWHYYTLQEGTDPETIPLWDKDTLYPANSIVKMNNEGELKFYQNHNAVTTTYYPLTCTTIFHTQPLNSTYNYTNAGKLEIIGNGYGTRSNARSLDWEGNERLLGDLYVHAYPDSTGGEKVVTESDLSLKADKTDTVLNTTLSHGRKENTTVGSDSFAFGSTVEASGAVSHAEGANSTASGAISHAEGYSTVASGNYSHAEGYLSIAQGYQSHAEGYGGTYTVNGTPYESKAVGTADHVEGYQCLTASNQPGNHAEGCQTRATGGAAHAEGNASVASGNSSHAEGLRSTASGPQSHAEGTDTTASASQTHAEGYSTKASESYSHAEGYQTVAKGTASHAEGQRSAASETTTYGNTTYYYGASGVAAHSEGSNTVAYGASSHAEGLNTLALGAQAHAEGNNTNATADYSHAEGAGTTASAQQAHAEGGGSTASGVTSHAEGGGTAASGQYSHSEGDTTTASAFATHAEGTHTTASAQAAHAEGYYTVASGQYSHAEGYHSGSSTTSYNNITYTYGATGFASHSEGQNTVASSYSSHAEGYGTFAIGQYSHAEGQNTHATSDYAHAEGYNTTASGSTSHAEGNNTVASGAYSHAEGTGTTASGMYSHAEGSNTVASGHYSHASGNGTTASKLYAYAEGYHTSATAESAHAEGNSTVAAGKYSHVSGKYNVADSYDNWPEWVANTDYVVGDKVKVTNGTTINAYICETDNNDSEFTVSNWSTITGLMNYAEIIGNGNSETPSNARALDWDGNEYLAGNVYVECSADSTGGHKLATEAFITNKIGSMNGVASLDANGKVPSSQLPSFVDDVLEYDSIDISEWDEWVSGTSYEVGDRVKVTTIVDETEVETGYVCNTANSSETFDASEWDVATTFPGVGESGKIYIALDTNMTYRWGGSTYVPITSGLALGETSSSAYRGDRGAAAYAAAVTNVELSPSSGSSNLITSGAVYTAVNEKYTKPVGGIPSTDLASDVIPDVSGFAPKDNPVFTGSISLGRAINSTVGTNSIATGTTVTATGNYSHAEGTTTTASGDYSHAEGSGTTSSGAEAHAEGYSTTASGLGAHSEGHGTIAKNAYQHVSGEYNVQDHSSEASVSRGTFIEIVGNGTADNARSNARVLTWSGDEYIKGDVYVHSSSDSTSGSKLAKVSELPSGMTGADGTSAGTSGLVPAPAATDNTKFLKGDGTWSTVDALPSVSGSDNGKVLTVSSGVWSAENLPTELPAVTGSDNGKALMVSSGAWSAQDLPTELPAVTSYDNGKALTVVEGEWTAASIPMVLPVVSGSDNGKVLEVVSGNWSLGTEKATKADPVFTGTINFGRKANTTTGSRSVALGYNVTASGSTSFAEGSDTTASGNYSHAEGYSTVASVGYNHAEGGNTQATALFAHAEGDHTTASAQASHAEGEHALASGQKAHAEGYYTTASGLNSHAEGTYTTAQRKSQHVSGEYNVLDNTGTNGSRGSYVEIIGNGTADNDRSNARALDWNGNEYLMGDVYVGCSVNSTGGSKLATETFVTGKMGAASGIAELDANGKVPSSQLPSYVDDVEEYNAIDFSEWPEWVFGTTYEVSDKVKITVTENNETTVTGYICTEDNNDETFDESKWDEATSFPEEGESGKIYIALDTNTTYRWGGSTYVVIGSSLALGTTSSTAYRGDYGAAAYAAAITNVDTIPTSLSTNLITSGGVYDAVNAKYTKPVSGIPASDLESGIIPDVSGFAPIANPEFTGSISLGRSSNTTIGTNSVAIGEGVTASQNYSYAEGYYTTASSYYSHAEGNHTTASSGSTHAEGNQTTASGMYAHSENHSTTASGDGSHAEGEATTASGYYAHSEGNHTTAQRKSQHVAGEYNVLDATGTTSTRGTYVEIIGNGSANNQRSNARALDWNGNEYLLGNIYVNCDPDSTNGTLLSAPVGMTGASALLNGTAGYVPASSAGDQNKYLRADATWHTIDTGVINVADYGAVGDGETDDSTAIQAAVNAGYDIYFESNKTYYIASPISIHHDIYLHGGENTTIKTVTPSGGTVINGIYISGQLKKTTTLTTDYSKDGTTANSNNRFTLSDMTDISIGDIMVITATDQYYSYARPYYYLGASLLVTDIYDGHIYTNEGMPFSITNTANVSVKIYSAPTAVVENLHFVSDLDSLGAYKYLLTLETNKNSVVRNCTFSNMVMGVSATKCVNLKIDGITFAKSKYDNSLNGDGYGLVVDSCTNTVIERVISTCGQHAISITGNLPAINTYIKHCELTSECRSPGLDTHEPIYNLVVEDSVLGTAALNGTVTINRCRIINNRRFSDEAQAISIYGSHNPDWAKFKITNTEFEGTGISIIQTATQNPVQTFDCVWESIEIENCSVGSVSVIATTNATILSNTIKKIVIRNCPSVKEIYHSGTHTIKQLIVDNVKFTQNNYINAHADAMNFDNIEYIDIKNINPEAHKIRMNRVTYGECISLPQETRISVSAPNSSAKYIVCGKNVVSNDVDDYVVGTVSGSVGGTLSRSAATGDNIPTISMNSAGNIVYSQGNNTTKYCLYPVGMFYVKEASVVTVAATLVNSGETSGSQFYPFIAVVNCSTGKLVDRYSGTPQAASSEGTDVSYSQMVGANCVALCYFYCNSPVSGAQTTFENYTVRCTPRVGSAIIDTTEKYVAHKRTGDGDIMSLAGLNNIMCSSTVFSVMFVTDYLNKPTYLQGATASSDGITGLVPAPSSGDNTKFLKGDGTWDNVDALPAVTSTDNGKVLEVSSGAWAVGTEKAPKASPVFTGSISLSRQSGFSVGTNSFAVGINVTASGNYASATGNNTRAIGASSHAEGKYTLAYAEGAHAEGIGESSSSTSYGALAQGSHSEGYYTKASGTYSHAEGDNTVASGQTSHAEGNYTTASGNYSHAEGSSTTASAARAHAEGGSTTASAEYSHAEGNHTYASGRSQHAGGEYNVIDLTGSTSTLGTYAEIIGNGTSGSARSNARALDWNGNEYLKGDVYVGCDADSSGGTKLTAPVAMTGATSSVAGAAGYAPAPAAGDDTKFLRGDGTWATAGADLGLIAAAYNSTATYSENDYCTHEGGLYKANQDISTAEAWTAAHWTQTTVMAEIIARCSIIPAAGVSF